jgi:hypothetical protein
MALQSRGFEVTNIPRAQGIDFNLQPGQFAAGLNSGIGAYNAFSNIAEEVRDRPLRQRERESRLAQIEAEAQMVPVRRQLTEIQLAKAGLPEDIVTGSTAVRVPRAGAPDQYDIVEQTEGFTFDPTTGQRTPFKRAGKLVASAEDMADRAMRRDAETARIEASREESQANAAARAEANRIKNEQLALAQQKFSDAVKRADEIAAKGKFYKAEGLDEAGNKVIQYTNPTTKEVFVLGSDSKLRPIQRMSDIEMMMLGRGAFGSDNSGTTPVVSAPASTPQAAPKAQTIQDVGIGVLDSIDDNGQPIITESEMTYDQGLPVFPQNTLSTSKGYKIIPR